MPAFKSDRFLYEINSWKRILLYLMEENLLMKEQLIVVLNSGVTKKLLDVVEYYQSALINEDKVASIFRKDIDLQQQKILLTVSGTFDEKIKPMVQEQKKLRKEIELVERYFNKLKFEFNKFIVETS